MIRSAAAVPKVFGNISNRPLLTKEELTKEYNPNDQTYLPGGMVLVGSHVKKTTRQLECLKKSNCPLEWIEFHVAEWKNEAVLKKKQPPVQVLQKQRWRMERQQLSIPAAP